MSAGEAGSSTASGASRTGGAAALRPLCRLHSYGCPAVHWLLGNQAALPHDALLASALDGLHSLLAAICDLTECLDEEEQGARWAALQRQLQVCFGAVHSCRLAPVVTPWPAL